MSVKHIGTLKQLMPAMPYIFFALIAVLLLLPLLFPGFILTLDMAFAPHIDIPQNITSSYLFYVGLHVLNIVLPGDLVQKLLLLAIFILSGSGMYALVQLISHRHKETLHPIAGYAAGIFYMINPYVYSRFMAGQYAVLLGYACLPFLIRSVLKLIKAPSLRTSMITATWLIIIGVVSIHTLGLAAVAMAIALGFAYVQKRRDIRFVRKLSIAWLGAVGVSFLANIYWIVPLLSGASMTASAVAGFNGKDFEAFATAGDGFLGKLLNVMQLQGFWADPLGLYDLPQAHVAVWGVITLIVWIMIGYGGWVLWRQEKRMAWFFWGIGIAGFVLAIVPVTQILGSILPVVSGLREPHKFVGLVVVAYAVGFGYACMAAVQNARRIYKTSAMGIFVAVLALLVPLAWTPTMAMGMRGQLQPRSYPAEWVAANHYLNSDRDSFSVLFLPWHGYQYFHFSGRIIVNPADKFFDKPTLASNQLDFKDASPTFPDRTKDYVSHNVIPAISSGQTLADKLTRINVKYVVVAREENELYQGIVGQPDIKQVFEQSGLRIYRNDKFEEE